jgi:hypothetical protein
MVEYIKVGERSGVLMLLRSETFYVKRLRTELLRIDVPFSFDLDRYDHPNDSIEQPD